MEGQASVAEALRHGHAAAARGCRALAAEQAREILAVAPGNADAYRLLGAALRRTGDDEEAEQAELDAISASIHDPELIRAAEALLDNDLPVAETILRARLHDKPLDVAAIRMMAELAGRIGRFADAENLLRRALELAPAFAAGARQPRHRALQAEPPGRGDRRAGPARQGSEAAEAHRNLKAAALGPDRRL